MLSRKNIESDSSEDISGSKIMESLKNPGNEQINQKSPSGDSEIFSTKNDFFAVAIIHSNLLFR